MNIFVNFSMDVCLGSHETEKNAEQTWKFAYFYSSR